MTTNPPTPNFTNLAARLGQVEHFSGLSTAELEEIIQSGRVRQYSRDEIIFVENEPGAGLFVLLAGRVQICKLSRDGQIAIIAVFDPVIMFNEVAALDEAPNPATAIALTDTTIWWLEHSRLENLILRYPRVGLGLLRVLANRNRSLVTQFENLSFRSVLARTARLLLELSINGTHPIDRHKYPNHQLAARIATVPEAFSRSLKVFRSSGDIQTTPAAIHVTNAGRLMEVAQVGPAAG